MTELDKEYSKKLLEHTFQRLIQYSVDGWTGRVELWFENGYLKNGKVGESFGVSTLNLELDLQKFNNNPTID